MSNTLQGWLQAHDRLMKQERRLAELAMRLAVGELKEADLEDCRLHVLLCRAEVDAALEAAGRTNAAARTLPRMP